MTQTHPISIAVIGLDRRDSQLVRSVVLFDNRVRNASWTLREDDKADVAFVDIDDPTGRHYWQQYSQHQLVVPISNGNGSADGLQKPLVSRHILTMLARVQTRIDNSRDLMSVTPVRVKNARSANTGSVVQLFNSSAHKSNQVNSSGDTFTYRVASAKTRQKNATRFSAYNAPSFVLDWIGSRALLTTDLEQLARWNDVSKDNIVEREVDAAELNVLEDSARIFTLEQALASIALSCSGGKLLPAMTTQKIFKLNRRPKIETFSSKSSHYRLNGILMRPQTLPVAARIGGVPVTDVVEFINAAYLCDWLETSDTLHSSRQSDNTPGRPWRSTIATIRKRLGIAAA